MRPSKEAYKRLVVVFPYTLLCFLFVRTYPQALFYLLRPLCEGRVVPPLQRNVISSLGRFRAPTRNGVWLRHFRN